MKQANKTRRISLIAITIILFSFFYIDNLLVNSIAESTPNNNLHFNSSPGDTVFIEKIIYDTIYDTVEIVNYIDTTPMVFHKKAFLYIKDTFNIEERTYYITDTDDTVKVFYFDYTYYVFNYTFKDTIVKVDSVIGCDLYTHCICDERDRIVVFHTCEGESRLIINMLNENQKP